MRIDIITIFPEMMKPVINESIIKRAQAKKKIEIRIHDLRDYTADKHRKVDDRPFGGGPGMVLAPQPIFDAVKKIKGRRKATVILTCPTGHPFTQNMAKELSLKRNIIFICGHYEGVDERVREGLVDLSLSIGDYVLTGGELPALVVTDAVVRLIPGVLGREESLHNESFEGGMLEYPQYTRPSKFLGKKVPDVLLSGNHADIEQWRLRESQARTRQQRPDLLK